MAIPVLRRGVPGPRFDLHGRDVSAPAASSDLTLDAAVDNPARSVRFLARDKARHPLEELTFFGIEPQSTVVEIWPGGGYWTESSRPSCMSMGSTMSLSKAKGEARRRRTKPRS
jgi:predicted methyltransferase